jgi:hypothetical protein
MTIKEEIAVDKRDEKILQNVFEFLENDHRFVGFRFKNEYSSEYSDELRVCYIVEMTDIQFFFTLGKWFGRKCEQRDETVRKNIVNKAKSE